MRNIITFITCTPQRREEFAKLTQEALPNETAFSPIIANQTRWNSDFKAIKRALQLHGGFEIFCARHVRDGLENDQLDLEDWKALQEMINVLEPFHSCTLLLEGFRGNGALYDMLPTMDTLLEHLETAKTMCLNSDPDDTSPFFLSIVAAWGKINKYYSMTASNAVLYAAVALHSGIKFDYFDINWAEHADWIKEARKKVEELWQTK